MEIQIFMIKNINEFQNRIVKLKIFKELPEQYKSTKFCKLYYKIYNYMLSIPKEKIVVKAIFYEGYLGRHGILGYLKSFLEVKDFYHWKDRIYSLLTEKLSATSKRKYELLYGFKWEEFYNQHQEKTKTTIENTYGSGITNVSQIEMVKKKKEETCLKNYGVKNPSQSESVKKKKENTSIKNYGNKYYTQTSEYKERVKTTCLEIYGVEHAAQSKEVQEKISNTKKNKSEEEKEQILEKQKATMLEKYNVISALQLVKQNGSHSKIADNMCLALDTLYGTLDSNDTKYFTKNGEYYLRTEDNHNFFYDFTNVVEKWIVEFQGLYSHGLKEGQEYVWNTPVEEVWKYDEEKRILAEQNGYKVFYVYEDEYKKDPKDVIENLLTEIKEYINSKNI